jgi:serine/threonine protein kinase/Tol biopolymer transport system component
MPLAPNTKLGRYEILSPLGAGGMGEVYLARDSQLDRAVALKILPAEVASNQERMRRFVQEARAAAALNHPSIAHIYEIGESGGTSFIAMEYVEGETLREKIHRDKTELRRLLEWLAQVADGLTKAHAAGILHRDLKPDNVMIARDGYAKILDFGLAKLVEPERRASAEGSASEAATALIPQLSQPGVVMGTVGYMSPEQAQGKPVDLRSDIFSFGCILFEAATGRKPFDADSVIASLHKTVYEPAPPLRELNPNAPPELQRILRRCLQKDPEERYQTIKDVAIELRELRREMDGGAEVHQTAAPSLPSASGASGSSGTSASGAGAVSAQSQSPTVITQPTVTDSLSSAPQTASAGSDTSRSKPRRRGLLFALAAFGGVALALGGYGVYRLVSGRGKPALTFQAARLQRLTTSGKVLLAAVSPDGKEVVHVVEDAGQQSLWVRQVATQSNVQIVPPANVQYAGLTFTPDGEYVYFLKGGPVGVLYQVPKLGGTPRKVIEDVDSAATFSPDGKRVAFIRDDEAQGESSLMIANSEGGGEQRLATRKEPNGFTGNVAWSPDGKVIACGVDEPAAGQEPEELAEVALDGGGIRQITPHRWGDINSFAWLRDGSGLLLSAADSSAGYFYQIWYVAREGGEPSRVTNDLSNYYGADLTADSNTLLTVQADYLSNLWVAPAGDSARARQVTSGKYDGYKGVVWTPDGHLVEATRTFDVWSMDADGGGARLLTGDEHTNRFVSVSPDGRYIFFESWRKSTRPNTSTGQVWRTDVDGGDPVQVTNCQGWCTEPHVAPDGKWFVYASSDTGTETLWRASVDGGAATQLTDALSFYPAISPDGKTIACIYRRDPRSPFKLALIPASGGQPVKEFDISSDAPYLSTQWQLRFSPDGRALDYIVNRGGVSNIWRQPLDGGQPKPITDFKSDLIFAFDWSRDGKQLALSRGTVTRDAVLVGNGK